MTGDGPDPRDVLRRINSRLGKTSDAFAVYKLEEMRDRLSQAIDTRDAIETQHRVIVAGHRAAGTDDSGAMVEQAEESLAEAEREAGQLATFMAGLLDAADDGENLREWIEEQREERVRQAQGQAGPPGL